MHMLAFLTPSLFRPCLSLRGWSHNVRCCVSSSKEAEPHFVAAIRAAAPAVLAERGLAIANIQWSGRRLSVFVSTRADVDGQLDAVGATSDECQFASRALGNLLDENDALVPFEEYTLEVSSPGTTDVLTKDREFEAFKGFHVTVATIELYKKKTCFEGTLHARTKDNLQINIKGRIFAIPRILVANVKLQAALEEPAI